MSKLFSQLATYAKCIEKKCKMKDECIVKMCKMEVVSLLDIFITIMKKECSTDKNSRQCEALREFEALKKRIKEDKLTHEHLKTMMRKLSQV